jgi:hypothetical protein
MEKNGNTFNNGNWQDYYVKKLNWEAILYYAKVAWVKCKRLLNNHLARRRKHSDVLIKVKG